MKKDKIPIGILLISLWSYAIAIWVIFKYLFGILFAGHPFPVSIVMLFALMVVLGILFIFVTLELRKKKSWARVATALVYTYIFFSSFYQIAFYQIAYRLYSSYNVAYPNFEDLAFLIISLVALGYITLSKGANDYFKT